MFQMHELIHIESLNVKLFTFFFPQLLNIFALFFFFFFFFVGGVGFPLKPGIQKPKHTYTDKDVCVYAYYL
jgi:hypothetical protein